MDQVDPEREQMKDELSSAWVEAWKKQAKFRRGIS